MLIKLLKDQATHVSDTIELNGNDVLIEFDVITISSSNQARLLDKASLIKDGESRLNYFKEQVKCVEGDKVLIAGDEFSAKELAEKGDFTHETTGAILAFISRQIDKVIFLDDDEAKK